MPSLHFFFYYSATFSTLFAKNAVPVDTTFLCSVFPPSKIVSRSTWNGPLLSRNLIAAKWSVSMVHMPLHVNCMVWRRHSQEMADASFSSIRRSLYITFFISQILLVSYFLFQGKSARQKGFSVFMLHSAEKSLFKAITSRNNFRNVVWHITNIYHIIHSYIPINIKYNIIYLRSSYWKNGKKKIRWMHLSWLLVQYKGKDLPPWGAE